VTAPTPTAEPAIALGDLTDARVLQLLEDHLADMHATSPAESVHALDVSGLAHPRVTFWTLQEGDEVLGCVALKQLEPTHGELKSMRTSAEHRGRGLGRLLLDHVIAEARRRGYRRLSLETGSHEFFAPARTLYARNGFEVCGPFGDYVLDPHSVFMKRELDR
jgi:putative acetyltransferase